MVIASVILPTLGCHRRHYHAAINNNRNFRATPDPTTPETEAIPFLTTKVAKDAFQIRFQYMLELRKLARRKNNFYSYLIVRNASKVFPLYGRNHYYCKQKLRMTRNYSSHVSHSKEKSCLTMTNPFEQSYNGFQYHNCKST